MAAKEDSDAAKSAIQKAIRVPGDVDFDLVIRAEIEDINARRSAVGRDDLLPVDIGYDDERPMLETAGLALSGGGIRSASFCLGVLQALNHFDAIRKIDYLSTVSGGGFMGASLSATMTKTGGVFPYGGGSLDLEQQPPEEISDTAAVSHIRNYSNYLIPFGVGDVLSAAAIVVRGLAANLGQVLGVILLLAALTVSLNPKRANLSDPNPAGLLPLDWLPGGTFFFTIGLALVLPLLFLGWALYRSFRVWSLGRSLDFWARFRLYLDPSFKRPLRARGDAADWVRRRRLLGRTYLARQGLSEFRGLIPRLAVWYLVLLAVAAFMEAQPFVIEGMFEVADAGIRDNGVAAGGEFFGLAASWIEWLAMITAPIAAFVAVFRKSLGDIIAASATTTRLRTQIAALFASSLVWIAGAAIPLLIWVGYLYLSFWAIPNDAIIEVPAVECTRDGASGTFRLEGIAGAISGDFDGVLAREGDTSCVDRPVGLVEPGPFEHTPGWMLPAATWINNDTIFGPYDDELKMLVLYIYCGVLLLVISLFLSPNANSLHRLYRDRLSKAFLFNPNLFAPKRGVAGDRDLAPCDSMKLTDIDPKSTPYHLINAALNIQGSDLSNRRGRNADFFMLSRRYVGGPATGYAQTGQVQKKAPALDLATALAISGAAASSNMGSKSVRALTPTLALLNVRLGYWLTNPYFAFRGEKGDQQKERPRRVWSYLWAEISSRLKEDSEVVYLTDGGHIENLGIYELLRRRCKLIVAVDAEADPEMRFNSLVTLQRYARIDLGVRIGMPVEQIAETTRAWMGVGGSAKPKCDLEPTRGPHVAIGTINYGNGNIGHLVYVKSSLTGDENDYVRDYARLHPRFPHETTGDQFFSEDQFEVYRALGFHVMYSFLSGTDDVAVTASLVKSPAPGLSSPTVPRPRPGARMPPSMSDKGIVVWADHPELKSIRAMLLSKA